MKRIAVVGAGIAGRLCAWNLRKAGHEVTLFEKNARHSQAACSFVAAGLLTPLAEAANGDPALATLGQVGMSHWHDLSQHFADRSLIDLTGSVTLSYRSDPAEFRDFETKLQAKNICFRPGDASSDDGEPDLDHEHLRYHVIPGEGRVDTVRMMKMLLQELEQSAVTLCFQTDVSAVRPGLVSTEQGTSPYDCVIDCRGYAASDTVRELRGVRGEVIHLRAPEVKITRPVRVLHPRMPAYIVPRSNSEYVVGATTIESEDDGPITVKSALELLGSVYNLHHGFRYASVIKTAAACRPAFSDNLPRIETWSDGRLICLNGLYRHGFLLGPLFATAVSEIVGGRAVRGELKAYVRSNGEML